MGDEVIGLGLTIAGVNSLIWYAQYRYLGDDGFLRYTPLYYCPVIFIGLLVAIWGFVAFFKALRLESKSSFTWEEGPQFVRDESWKQLPAHPQERKMRASVPPPAAIDTERS